jgi:hypothetical protein
MNLRIRKNNTSGVTGVKKRGNKWQAYIEIGGVGINLGYYCEKDGAIAARLEAEDQYQGTWAARHSRSPRRPMPDLFA